MRKSRSPIQTDGVLRLKKFFEASSEGLFFHDQGIILEVNSSITDILGYDSSHLIGTNLLNYVAPEQRDNVMRRMQSNDDQQYETMVVHSDGTIFPIMVRASSIESAGETIRIAAIRDITEYKITEDNLRDIEQRNNEIIQNVPGVVYQILVRPDKSIEIPYISDGIEEITGISSEEVVANPALAFAAVLEEDLPAVRADIIGSADKMQQSNIIFRMKNKNGEICWFHGSSRPTKLEDGSVLKNGILLDITEKKKAEQALVNSQQNFIALAENSKDGFLVNLDGNHVFANTSLAIMLGYDSADDLLGTSMKDIVHPSKFDEVMKIHRNRKNGKQTENQYETLFRREDGSALPVELNANLTTWNGKSAGMVTIRDISARRLMEKELATHKIDLEKLVAQRSAELHESEARLLHLVSSSPGVIYTLKPDKDFSPTYVSENVIDLFGFTVEQCLEEPGFWANKLHPDDAPVVFDNLSELFENNSLSHEYRFRLNNNRYVWVHDELRLLRSPDGTPIEIIGTWYDITEQKAAEEKYRSLFELSDDANMTLDQDSFIDCNEATLVMFGCASKEDFLGKHPSEISPPKQVDGSDSRIAADSRIAVAYKKGKNLFEWTHRRMNGEKFPAEVLLKPMVINGKNVLQAIVRDITARKHAENLIKQNAELYRDLYESIPLAYFIANEDGTLAKCNQRACALLGYSMEALIGMPISNLYADTPDGRIKAGAINEEVNAGVLVTGEEVQMKKSDGTSIWVSLSVQPSSQGHQRRAIAEDISERKEVEKQFIQAKEEAEKANNAKSEFLSRMSHELRTPLNAILGFGQLMQMGAENLSHEQQESVKHIVEGGEHLLHLINEILDISKVDAGKMELSIEPVHVWEVVESSFTLVRPLAQKKDVSLKTNLDFCACVLKADKQRLIQAMVNLFSNAIKYGREGGEITVCCSVVKDTLQSGKQSMARIDIIDNGIGIRESDFNKIFEPFQRVSVRGAPVEGTGIGLAITKKMINLMGGTIGFESEYGKGSTFWFEMPLDAHNQEQYIEPEKLDDGSHKVNSSKTILYVEDSAANRKLVAQLLNRFTECKLLCADNAESGIDIAKDQNPDLILMDIGLPGMDGFEALKVLRENNQTSQIPVVAVTAHAMPDSHEKGLKAGFSHYLTKPIEMNKLLATIESIRSR